RRKAKALIGDIPFKSLSEPHSEAADWLPDGQACYLPRLHVMVLSLSPDQFGVVRKFTEAGEVTQLVMPEKTMKVHAQPMPSSIAALAPAPPPHLVDYVHGYKDAVVRLLDSLAAAALGGKDTVRDGAVSEYLRGYREGLLNISAQLQSGQGMAVPGDAIVS